MEKYLIALNYYKNDLNSVYPAGTYSDLLIIEPAIPIMVDSHVEKKKKKKKSSLKRSRSNASIRDATSLSERRRKQIEKLETSAAGVLFYDNIENTPDQEYQHDSNAEFGNRIYTHGDHNIYSPELLQDNSVSNIYNCLSHSSMYNVTNNSNTAAENHVSNYHQCLIMNHNPDHLYNSSVVNHHSSSPRSSSASPPSSRLSHSGGDIVSNFNDIKSVDKRNIMPKRYFVEDVTLSQDGINDENTKNPILRHKRHSYPWVDVSHQHTSQPRLKLNYSMSVDEAGSSAPCYCNEDAKHSNSSKHHKKSKRNKSVIIANPNEYNHHPVTSVAEYCSPRTNSNLIAAANHDHPYYQNGVQYVSVEDMYKINGTQINNGYNCHYEPNVIQQTNGYHVTSTPIQTVCGDPLPYTLRSGVIDVVDHQVSTQVPHNHIVHVSSPSLLPRHNETSPPRPMGLKGKTRLRSDNWEWYSSQPSRHSSQGAGSSSETVSTCSDSSFHKVVSSDVIDDISTSGAVKVSPERFKTHSEKKKKKRSKARQSQVLVEETEANGGS